MDYPPQIHHHHTTLTQMRVGGDVALPPSLATCHHITGQPDTRIERRTAGWVVHPPPADKLSFLYLNTVQNKWRWLFPITQAHPNTHPAPIQPILAHPFILQTSGRPFQPPIHTHRGPTTTTTSPKHEWEVTWHAYHDHRHNHPLPCPKHEQEVTWHDHWPHTTAPNAR
jgi:hypothetical protein